MHNLFNLSHYPQNLQIPQIQLDYLQQQLSTNEIPLPKIQARLQGVQLKQFHTTIIGSRFAAEFLCRNPEWLARLIDDHLNDSWIKSDYQTWFKQSIQLPLQQWDQHLRQQRNKAMSRIIWRDFNRITNTQETTAELTAMAESAIQAAMDYHYYHLCETYGAPLNEKGLQQPMLVIGMGKLGAWELNLSSDVDLIFTYPQNGSTNGDKSLSNQEFFTKLGQKMIHSLNPITADGFVFRVDMRLRPYGQSGPLVSNFAALEDYYQYQGREWERFAMIKARVVAQTLTPPILAGDQQDGAAKEPTPEQSLMLILRSFTYRSYVDFSAIDALRNLKQLINRDVKRRKLSNNIKLGTGGIREVEFIAQAFQIIRGGRDKALQSRQLLKILPLLPKFNGLPEGLDNKLIKAYLFLRNTEHAIQGYQDKQSQDLPLEPLGLARIAFIMGYDDIEAFQQELDQHRALIHHQFNAVIATPEEQPQHSQAGQEGELTALWLSLCTPSFNDGAKLADEVDSLTEWGFHQAEDCLRTLIHLSEAPSILALSSISRQRLDQLMPLLLRQLSESPEPNDVLVRLSALIIAIVRRSAYLLLLIENPQALKQLITLSQASPWIADKLAQHPALLDELLNPESLYSPPQKHELARDLQLHMLRIEQDDLEGQMEGLRYFKSAHSLRVAACEATGRMPLMKVSDYLSELAEVICEYSLQQAWNEMTQRYGYPDNTVRETANFIVIGYGKLGGIELGHNSDLDLVFIHNADTNGYTSGIASNNHESPSHQLDNHTFYTRLGQKFIHMLNTRTPAGQLYEIDMRLRPSGNSGLLTTSLQAFERYQNKSAWTWEHQALVRARAVAGCPTLVAQFRDIRHQILSQIRPIATLKKDVVDMRQKMRDQLGSTKRQKNQGLFHLKQDSGGIVDIEFMVQYAVLAGTSNYGHILSQYTDNIRILSRLKESKQLRPEDVDQLASIYKTYRAKGHQLALQQQSNLIAASEFAAERKIIKRIWGDVLG